MNIFRTLIFLLFLIPSVSIAQTPPPPMTGPLVENMEGNPGLSSHPTYGWFYQVYDPPNSIGIATDPIEGDKSLKCTVLTTGSTNGGERCEILYQPYDPAGATRTYEYKFLIMPSFPDPQNGEWVHFGQWDDQPPDGNWDNHPAGSPVISVDYSRMLVSSLPQSVVDYWNLLFVGWEINIDNMGTPGNTADDQISMFSISVGTSTPKPVIAAVPMTKGQWQPLGFEIKWSYNTNNGFVKFYYNGVLKGEALNINNMGNNYPHFFKTGVYRQESLNTQMSGYFDDIKIY